MSFSNFMGFGKDKTIYPLMVLSGWNETKFFSRTISRKYLYRGFPGLSKSALLGIRLLISLSFLNF